MFTGLVQGTGRLTALEARGTEGRLTVSPDFSMGPFVLGESIAVNGACLTVEARGRTWFTAYASAETLERTNLDSLRLDSAVNLERALALGDRLGGHLVTGHVDCLARVLEVSPRGQSRRLRLCFPPEYGRQVVAKGSVALDGISLTVNLCGRDFLEVNIIPATWQGTTMGLWKAGTMVNMETDIIGKYVERMVGPWAGQESPGGGLTMEFLREHGF